MPIAETLRFLIGPLELLHEQAGPRLLRLVRFGLFLLWIGKLLLDPLWRLADLPKEMFNPPGPLALLPAPLLDHLMTSGGLTAYLVVTLVVLLWALTNCAFPIAATLAAILLTYYSCIIRSFGPAVHTDIVPLLGVYALAGFAWADLIEGAITGKKAPAAWSSYPLITLVTLLCIPYMLVGLNRGAVSGAPIFLGHSMEVWTIDASLRGYYFNTNIGWHIPEWPLIVLMLKLGLPVITVFEITAPLCLAWPRYRWVFIPTMLSFHLLSLVFMNILFFDDMFLYLLLIDWSRRFPSLRQ